MLVLIVVVCMRVSQRRHGSCTALFASEDHWPYQRRPKLVAPVIQMEAVFQEEFRPRLAVRPEHRSGDVEIDQLLVSLAVFFNERVRLPYAIYKLPTENARF